MKIQPPPPTAELLAALAKSASASGYIELPDFIETALYHPTEGYYRRPKSRIGKNRASDFYTSLSLKDAFSEIVTEAALALLEQARMAPGETAWVELGAEPGGTLLDGTKSPFQSLHTIGAADPLVIPEQAVVFSNELFDAQPFRQVRFDGQAWQEFGVTLRGDKAEWTQRSALSDEAAQFAPLLPKAPPAGYTIDLPTGSMRLARKVLQQSWRGAFIAFDYGKTWQGLAEDSPQGTARAYYQHQLLPDILVSPGQVDITHHICWDPIEAELARQGFESISLQSQEAFIVRRSPHFLQKAFDPQLPAFAPVRQKLKELMHPALMGQKFQALAALRTAAPAG